MSCVVEVLQASKSVPSIQSWLINMLTWSPDVTECANEAAQDLGYEYVWYRSTAVTLEVCRILPY